MQKLIFFYIFIFLISEHIFAQAFYGLTVDEKFSVHKNRIGISAYRQGKKNGKLGITINHNFSVFKYPYKDDYYNTSPNVYSYGSPYTPPYINNLGNNSKSIIHGVSLEVFNNLRLKTFSHSNIDLKISIGYGHFNDTYTTEVYGQKKKGKFSFNSIMCNMYFGYLIWYKRIGFEPIFGIAYYYPLLSANYYLAPNPFVAAELEAGISFYYKKNKKHHR